MENAEFLRHLRRTGNASTAARAVGFERGRFLERRRKHPGFALQWDAALALAHGALGRAAPASPERPISLTGEPHIVRGKSGRLHIRKARSRTIDHAARQNFLAALSATANVVLSAAAAGYSTNAIYEHRRRNPAFAREWRLALERGYERLKLALLETGLPESFADDDWRCNDSPALPPMTVSQALHLMHLHRKEALDLDEPPHLKRRRGENREAHLIRLSEMYEARRERERMKYRIAEAERLARGEPTYHRWEPGELPDLAQVTGWSRASDKPSTDASRALFGGWRMEDIPAGKRKGGG
jgi:hypothetical protein